MKSYSRYTMKSYSGYSCINIGETVGHVYFNGVNTKFKDICLDKIKKLLPVYRVIDPQTHPYDNWEDQRVFGVQLELEFGECNISVEDLFSILEIYYIDELEE